MHEASSLQRGNEKNVIPEQQLTPDSSLQRNTHRFVHSSSRISTVPFCDCRVTGTRTMSRIALLGQSLVLAAKRLSIRKSQVVLPEKCNSMLRVEYIEYP